MVSSRPSNVFPLTPEVQIVPKYAATLASLLLIAGSIGVNIARYPQVGRTADARQPTDAAQPANAALAAPRLIPVETANPDPLPVRKTEIEPVRHPQGSEIARAENVPVEAPLDPKPATGSAHPRPVPAVTILDVRPMVPIASLPAVAGVATLPADSDEVRRLPPVEPGVSAITEIQTGGHGAQSYTATSTP